MKKFSKFLLFSVLAIFLMTGSAMAISHIDVQGYVDPYNATTTPGVDANGYATMEFDNLTYTFIVVNDYSATGTLSLLGLQFESDVFLNQTSYAVTVNTSGWSDLPISGEWSDFTADNIGSELSQGQTLSITFDNVVLYTAALSAVSFDYTGDGVADGNWSEGQIWAQSFGTLDLGGGSTSPVPEPATMLLLGTGLIGLAGLSRKRFKG